MQALQREGTAHNAEEVVVHQQSIKAHFVENGDCDDTIAMGT